MTRRDGRKTLFVFRIQVDHEELPAEPFKDSWVTDHGLDLRVRPNSARFRSADPETLGLLSHGLVRQVAFRVAFDNQAVDGLRAQPPELFASLRCPKGTHGPLRGPGHQQGLIERRQRCFQISCRYLPFGGQECPERRPMLGTNKTGDGAPHGMRPPP
ncbi:hypothetical protein AB8E26_01500 [Stenotrophomonas rhizophila]|uniref:hypothetical protein n=1 Tax=Stenotrophomonas rhizophila TaxID=216778 RepID=UPI0035117A8B